MSNKINLLIVTDSLNAGGIETYVMNIAKFINKDKFKVIICVVDKNRNEFVDKIKDYCVIAYLPNGNKIKKSIYFERILKKYNINIIHFQIRHSYLIIISKIYNSKVILHAHFSIGEKDNNFKTKIKRRFLKNNIDKMLACSDNSGKNSFLGLDYEVVNNGVDFSKFKYDNQKSQQIRKKYNILDKEIVILQVGRLNYNKNQLFTMKIFKKLITKNKNYRLIIIGDGEMKDDVVSFISDNKLNEKILLIKSTTEMSHYYSASDVLVQPSLFEGLPFTMIEAQINGLVCLASDQITPDANISGNVKFLPIDKGNSSINLWINELIKIKNNKSNRAIGKKLEKSNYNVLNTIKKLEQIYQNTIGLKNE